MIEKKGIELPKQYRWGHMDVEDKLYTRYDEQFRIWMSISMSHEHDSDFPIVTHAFISTVFSASVGSVPNKMQFKCIFHNTCKE